MFRTRISDIESSIEALYESMMNQKRNLRSLVSIVYQNNVANQSKPHVINLSYNVDESTGDLKKKKAHGRLFHSNSNSSNTSASEVVVRPLTLNTEPVSPQSDQGHSTNSPKSYPIVNSLATNVNGLSESPVANTITLHPGIIIISLDVSSPNAILSN